MQTAQNTIQVSVITGLNMDYIKTNFTSNHATKFLVYKQRTVTSKPIIPNFIYISTILVIKRIASHLRFTLGLQRRWEDSFTDP